MKVFLTGATGYIGSSVAEALQKAGHQVTGLARSRESAEKLRKRGIEQHAGDMRDKESLRAAARRADSMIHAASPSDGSSAEADNLTLDAILAELKGTNKPFVYTSGIWVLGDTDGKLADESFPLHPAALVAWRVVCEQRVLASGSDGILSSIIRPAIVYGRGGGIPGSFVRAARDKGAVIFVGDGENHWPGVHIDDLADLYVRALEKAPAGSLFHAVQGEARKVRDVALAAAEAAGRPGKVTPWPLEAARKTLGPYADALALDQKISAEKAHRILNWQPKQAPLLDDLRHGSYKASAAS
jgi:nucleoside-diphosphate-sugar epimerase